MSRVSCVYNNRCIKEKKSAQTETGRADPSELETAKMSSLLSAQLKNQTKKNPDTVQ